MLAIVSESSSILIFPLSFCRAATFTFVIWPVQPWETFNTGSLCSPENCGLFAEESFIFSKLPGYFIIPFLTSKKKIHNTHPSLIFLHWQSDTEVIQESTKPTRFSISKLPKLFSFFSCTLPRWLP